MSSGRELQKTLSVCPVCLQRIPASYREKDGQVWMEKTCPEDGIFSVPVWDSVEGFEKWQRNNLAQKPVNPSKKVKNGCPYDCGICENHRQATCCVLLEITQRCNLGCPICFASAECTVTPDPSIETIGGWYDMLLSHGGPFNIQLSGGEPSLRDDLPEIIQLGKDKGFQFFQLNTNGIRLAQELGFVSQLAMAGLNTVFLQFDSLQPEGTVQLRGKNLVEVKKQAIRNCIKAGLGVVLVPTIMPNCNEEELGELVEFAASQMPGVRGIHFQPISYFGRYDTLPKPENRLTIPVILKKLEEQTQGKVKARDFLAGGAEHPLCSFHSDYTVNEKQWSCITSAKTGCCCAEPDCGTSDAAREAVALKWSAPKTLPTISLAKNSCYDFSALDDFLEKKNQSTLAISGMAFQDAWTVDLQRLQRCYIHVVSPSNTLVPFCSYNLTTTKGASLYRNKTSTDDK